VSVLTLLDAIVGHQAQIEQLKRLADNNSAPHALMFVGRSGIGKRSAALAFAAALLGRKKESRRAGSPPEVQSEKLILSGSHPDLHFVHRSADKKDLPVDAIRGLCSSLQLKPYCSGCSVAIIDNAHEMSIGASNALLMTLEEPPRNTYLILVTDSPQVLPETIVSRCQLLHFGELSTEEIEQIVQRTVGQDSLKPELLKRLSAYAGASLAPLGLSDHINPITSSVTDKDAVLEHLSDLLSHVKTLDRQLAPLFEDKEGGKNLVSYAVALAASLSAEKESLPIAWYTLNARIRQKLRDSKAEQPRTVWAEALLASLDAEQLVRQRNLSPQLQLSSVLVHIAERG
jgi:hypothetical protein